jgi:amino-acid N-acetyltransferase
MEIPAFHLRDATAEDLAAVTALLRASKLAPNAVDAQFGPQFSVAIDSGDQRVIGVAGIEVYGDAENTLGLLRSAAVDPAWRNHGIGRALTEDRLAWAARHKLAAVYLLTETAADYWPRFGFARMERALAPEPLMASHEWRQGCPASAVAMVRTMPTG